MKTTKVMKVMTGNEDDYEDGHGHEMINMGHANKATVSTATRDDDYLPLPVLK